VVVIVPLLFAYLSVVLSLFPTTRGVITQVFEYLPTA
jgi:hypothetical protein